MASPRARNNKEQSLQGTWHNAVGYPGSMRGCVEPGAFQAARVVFTRTGAETQQQTLSHIHSPPSQQNQQSCNSPDRTQSHPCPHSQVTPDLPVLFCSNLRPFPGRIRLYNSELCIRIHLFPFHQDFKQRTKKVKIRTILDNVLQKASPCEAVTPKAVYLL